MSDLKLFRLAPEGPSEVKSSSVALEKSLQKLVENNLAIFLSVRFLASEFSTGPVHGGRIDTLGIDENNCPVIIEYKRSLNQNVINQGLFYLNWLLDHKGDFKVLVQDRLGQTAAEEIDWSSPRLLCIAGDYTKYDEHAIQQINQNIELIRYRNYGEEFLLFELAKSHTAVTPESSALALERTSKMQSKDRTVENFYVDSASELTNLFDTLKAFCIALGDDVQLKTLKHYYAFRRLKNFACVEFRQKSLTLYLYVNPDSIELEEGFTRDVRNVGHYGTGTLEVKIFNNTSFEKAKPLILSSYESS